MESGHSRIFYMRAAASLAREQFVKSHKSGVEIEMSLKSPGNPVTRLDMLIEETIVEHLSNAFPAARFLCEERGSFGAGDRIFIIDPIDGTRNLLRGSGDCAVSIAYSENNTITSGVILRYGDGLLASVEAGRGALIDSHPLNRKNLKNADQVHLIVGLPNSGASTAARARIFAQLQAFSTTVFDIKCFGSAALSLLAVATGKADAFWEIGLKIWDIAAGALFVLEMGGEVAWDEQTGQIFAVGPSVGKALAHCLLDRPPQIDYGKFGAAM